MVRRIRCPFCGGIFNLTAAGEIHKHGARDARYPNCGGPVVPANARCTACLRVFEDEHGFSEHRDKGTCRNPAGLGYRLVEDVWKKTG